ncbi:MAG: serine hydrolase [Planctomycetes bacterium]|nr:serine hydrolase [Planctomycetota bacterium]
MALEKKIPYLETPYISAKPRDMKDGITVGELGKDGGDKEAMMAFAQEIGEEPNKVERSKTDSVLVYYKGKLLFESYYRRGRENIPHFQMSITKSYTGFALARAIQLGYMDMEDLQKPIFNYLAEVDQTKLSKEALDITLAETLNMTSGLELIREKIKAYKETPEKLKGQGQIQAYFDSSKPIVPAPRKFRYQPSDPAIIMQILESIVPGSAKDFIANELMGKMGISQYAWQEDTSGLPKSAAGSSFRSRDMLKVGIMLLNKGVWNDEQLIPAEFVNKALSPITLSYGANYYGYFCWNQTINVSGKSYGCWQLRGALGQYVMIIPEEDIVVVVTSHGAMGPLLQGIPKRILPAFIGQ